MRKGRLQAEAVLKALLASLLTVCILTTLLNVLLITAEFKAEDSNLANSHDENADSQSRREMMEDAYPCGSFEDRIVGVREFNTSPKDAVGLEV